MEFCKILNGSRFFLWMASLIRYSASTAQQAAADFVAMHWSRFWKNWTCVWQANLLLVRWVEQSIVQNSLWELSYNHYQGSLKFALSEYFQINLGRKSDPILFILANRFSQLIWPTVIWFWGCQNQFNPFKLVSKTKKVAANNIEARPDTRFVARFRFP